LEIGKAIIAVELLKREFVDKLWETNANWLQYLYARMMSDTLERFAENRVAFITYNRLIANMSLMIGPWVFI
jgi:hypothetical protein